MPIFFKKAVEAYVIANGTDQWIQSFHFPGDCWENEVREIPIYNLGLIQINME